jgi:hypothetical protein
MTMKTLLATLLLATLCSTAYGQTLKSVMYNTTNNMVVGLSNAQRLNFEHIGLTAGTATAPSLTYASGTNSFGTFASTAIGVGPFLGFSVDGTRRFFISTNAIRAELPLSFNNATNEALTRTNLGLGATWLTNDNVTNFRTAIGVSPATIWAYKETNQTNATTNLVSDTALTFTAAANTKYAVTLLVNILDGEGNIPTDGVITIATNAQVLGQWTVYEPINTGTRPSGTSVTQRQTFFIPEDGDTGTTWQRFVVIGATNTNSSVTFEFAKAITNAGAVIIGAGSYLKAEVIE